MAFLFAAFLVYCAMHAYAFLAARAAFALAVPASAALAATLAFLTFAPVLAHVLDRRGAATTGRALARVGYLWMGLLILFVGWHLAVEAAALAMDLARRWGAASLPDPSARGLFAAAALLAVVSALYGAVEARRVRVRRLTLACTGLPAGHEPVRVVQISDLHLGAMTGVGSIRRLAARLTALRPDLLVSTGDLVDGDIARIGPAARVLAAVPARLGKFAVIGNHECYAGLDRAVAFTRRAGFTVLRNAARAVGDALVVIGVDDPAAGGADAEVRVFDTLPGGRCTLLLKHRPMVNAASLGRFDLQLSGHTHGGQIFPFGWVVRRAYPVRRGLSEPGAGSRLYLSAGTGSWGPPIRFLAPPEIAVIELVPAATMRGTRPAPRRPCPVERRLKEIRRRADHRSTIRAREVADGDPRGSGAGGRCHATYDRAPGAPGAPGHGARVLEVGAAAGLRDPHPVPAADP